MNVGKLVKNVSKLSKESFKTKMELFCKFKKRFLCHPLQVPRHLPLDFYYQSVFNKQFRSGIYLFLVNYVEALICGYSTPVDVVDGR